MKKLAANDILSMVLNGVVVTAENGILMVEDAFENLARSHGATDVVEDAKVRIVEVEKRVEVPVEKIVEKIVEVEAPENNDPDSDTTDNIDEMKRAELLVSLKALGIPYKLPLTNDDLRKLLREGLAKRLGVAGAAPAPVAPPQAPPAPPAEPAQQADQQQPPQSQPETQAGTAGDQPKT